MRFFPVKNDVKKVAKEELNSSTKIHKLCVTDYNSIFRIFFLKKSKKEVEKEEFGFGHKNSLCD